jgi:hypothetical protein
VEVITGGHGSGKTTRAIAWLREDPQRRAMVCSDAPTMERLRRENPDLPYRAFVTIRGALSNALRGKAACARDDLDLVLEGILGTKIDLVTTTDSGQPPTEQEDSSPSSS